MAIAKKLLCRHEACAGGEAREDPFLASQPARAIDGGGVANDEVALDEGLVEERQDERALRDFALHAPNAVRIAGCIPMVQLEVEARRILQGYARDIREKGLDYRQLFAKTKEKLARDRGFVL